MTRQVIAPREAVFEYTRPVRPPDACFEPGVYHQGSQPLGESQLLRKLTSYRPLSVAEPAAQGKSSLMAYAEDLVRRKAGADWLAFRGDDSSCPTAGDLLAWLSDELESPPDTRTLAQALDGSQRLARSREGGRGVILLLDLTRCHAADVTEWAMGSIPGLDRAVDLLAMRVQVLVVTGHSQLDPLCAPHLSHDADAISISNLTEAQSHELLERAALQSPAVVFDEGARAAVFERARGDKYFTNFLASLCAYGARPAPGGGDDRVVDETVVNVTANLIASGVAPEERILPGFTRAVAESEDVARALDILCQGRSEAWAELRPQQKAALDELGAVGPIWDIPEQPRPVSWRRDELRTLRNPMVADLARSLLTRRRSRIAVSSEAPRTRTDDQVSSPSERASRAEGRAETGVTIGPYAVLQVGETEYEFRTPVMGIYSPEDRSLTVPGLESFGPAHGDSAAEAFTDWCHQFHLGYQQLAARVATGMSRRDQKVLREIEAMIDTQAMEKKRTITVRQIGVVQRVGSNGVTFLWEDKERDTVPLALLPAECACFTRGQRVEAVVRRALSSYEVERVLHAQPLPPVPRLTEREADELWNSLPGSGAEPAASWD
jgi:hypothetical protein